MTLYHLKKFFFFKFLFFYFIVSVIRRNWDVGNEESVLLSHHGFEKKVVADVLSQIKLFFLHTPTATTIPFSLSHTIIVVVVVFSAQGENTLPLTADSLTLFGSKQWSWDPWFGTSCSSSMIIVMITTTLAALSPTNPPAVWPWSIRYNSPEPNQETWNKRNRYDSWSHWPVRAGHNILNHSYVLQG